MSNTLDFKAIQHQFAQHIRDPNTAINNLQIEDRRMAIYRRLFFNNIENFIASGFPVLRTLYSDENWLALVRDFFMTHRCESPYFLEISETFLYYYQNEHPFEPHEPPFGLELAHYEWMELALSVLDETIDISNIDSHGDLLSGMPVISPLARVLNYQWPVHKISTSFQPTQMPDELTHIVVYRDATDNVRFVVINLITAMLLQYIDQAKANNTHDILHMLAHDCQMKDPKVMIDGGLSTLQDLKEKGVILGVCST